MATTVRNPRDRVVLFRVTREEFSEIQGAVDGGLARSNSDLSREVVLARVRGGSVALAGASDNELIAELQARLSAKKPHPE